MNKHRRVDDIPYGGGMGMVMQADLFTIVTTLSVNNWEQNRIQYI